MARISAKRQLIEAASAALEYYPVLIDLFDQACGVTEDSPERDKVTRICGQLTTALGRIDSNPNRGPHHGPHRFDPDRPLAAFNAQHCKRCGKGRESHAMGAHVA